MAVIAVGIQMVTQGRLAYTLDDSYIHLSLARSIADGTYGLQPGQSSSPASSILWPFLLVPLSGTRLAAGSPMLFDVPATFVTGAAVLESLATRMHWRGAAWATCGLVTFGNVVGVAFTGLEHSLQVSLAALTTLGVLQVIEGALPRWLPVVLVLNPLVRYEGIAVSLAGASVVFMAGHRRPAVTVTVGWMTVVGAFTWFLVHLGLDPLPSSVLAHQNEFNQTVFGPVASVQARAISVLVNPWVIVGVVVLTLGLRRKVIDRRLYAFSAIVLLLHVALGRFGWLGRYEVYLVAALGAPVLFALRGISQGDPGRRWLLGSLLGASLTPLIAITPQTPWAAREIGLQQLETARFVRDYWQAPIAVNDVGAVSYYGGQTTVDVWGLADQAARHGRMAAAQGWLNTVVSQARVDLVAIYPEWFPGEIPTQWVEVAVYSSPARVSTSSPDVHYFATSQRALDSACRAVTSFSRATLPSTRMSVLCQTH